MTSLASAGVETTAEAFETRMKMLRSTSAAPLTSRALRIAAIQQEIELQLIKDGLEPDRLHLVGGDEPDEEAIYFEEVWRRSWQGAAEERLDEASAAPLALERTRDQLGEAEGGLCVAVLSREENLARLPPHIARLIDLELSAEGGTASGHDCLRALFDRTLRRAVSSLPASTATETGIRWVHVSGGASLDGDRDIEVARSLGARTIALPSDAGWKSADARIASVAGLAGALGSVCEAKK